MKNKPPLPYSPDIEDIRDDEADIVASVNDAFDTILETTLQDYGHAVRAVHAKAHAVLEGEFEVEAGLPASLGQGLFAESGTHKAYLRISTNPGDILDDAIALPRGIALKVLDVKGERLPDAEGSTQDFIMVNAPVFTAPDARSFSRSLKLLAHTTDKAEGAKIAASKLLQVVNGALSKVGLESAALGALGGAPQVDPLGETYFSVTPFRYGRYVAKFRLRPCVPALTALTGTKVETSGDPDALRHAVQRHMASIDAEWSFEVQLRNDEQSQPIEDASVEWKEAEAPFIRVATVRMPRQDSWSPQRVVAINDRMRFSVWTGLAAHRPLGNINRIRRDAYQHSAQFRARANACPLHEPATPSKEQM